MFKEELVEVWRVWDNQVYDAKVGRRILIEYNKHLYKYGQTYDYFRYVDVK